MSSKKDEFKKRFIELYDEEHWKAFMEIVASVQQEFGHQFNDEFYFYNALSVRGSRLPPDTFERYEFLGDSILQAVVSIILFEKEDRYAPGELTDMRKNLCNNEYIAEIAHKMKLNEVATPLMMGNLTRGQSADMFEALICALFFDCGWNFRKLRPILEPILDIENAIDEINLRPWGRKDSKSYLHELLQKKFPEYKFEYLPENIGSQNAPNHVVLIEIKDQDDTIIEKVKGQGSPKKKDAEKSAAETLLLKWKKEGKLDA